MLLEILIPTYNRAEYLEKNIKILITHITRMKAEKEIGILISNNFSLDNTNEILEKYKNYINLAIYQQSKNIGLEKNAVFCLSKSKAKYVMYLGDDDFIEFDYLKKIFDVITKEKNTIKCILPSYIGIDMDGKKLGGVGRDFNEVNKTYSLGKYNAAKLMQKGHQLSGVTFFREGTIENYLKTPEDRNIYLFMYFVGFNIKRGDCYHLTENPVEVTQPPQDKKDWNYGVDGLYNERFKNSKALFKEEIIYRVLSEVYMVKRDPFLMYYYKNKGFSGVIGYLGYFMKLPDATIVIKMIYLPYSAVTITKRILKKVVEYIIK